MTTDCWHDWKGRRKMLSRNEDITQKQHGKVLMNLIHGISHLKTIDLGCGNQRCALLFSDYKGVDLPEFDIYESDLKFISKYDIVLMNAFIDVLEKPLYALEKVLSHSTNYVVLHRQEITKKQTTIEKRESYGGWTWHSKINENDFYNILKETKFVIKKQLSCGFNNWENGGSSFLLKRIET